MSEPGVRDQLISWCLDFGVVGSGMHILYPQTTGNYGFMRRQFLLSLKQAAGPAPRSIQTIFHSATRRRSTVASQPRRVVQHAEQSVHKCYINNPLAMWEIYEGAKIVDGVKRRHVY